ncbi:MAG: hypothetical protein IJW50_09015 [Clostridia bacterium]|nr:hypothetical protein [Clostridia bacterium]
MKKMRKLLPAFAMLLVSAIMMSTASFAWFSMNEQVTATGMSVQAKAAGNLLISTAPLTGTTQTITVALDSTKQEILPTTYGTYTAKDAQSESTGFWVPSDYTSVDATYGTYDETTKKYDAIDTDADTIVEKHFAEYTVYLATAGDKMEDQILNVKINGVSGEGQFIAPAYTIAFYVIVGGTENDTTNRLYMNYDSIDWDLPTTTVSYDACLKDAAANNNAGDGFVKVAEDLLVPSTYGVPANGGVGLQIVMRVFVDGALEKGTVTVKNKTMVAYSDQTTYYDPSTMSNLKFYANPTGTGDELSKDGWKETTEITNYWSWDGTSYGQDSVHKQNYVNNDQIPTVATILDVVFKLGDLDA